MAQRKVAFTAGSGRGGTTLLNMILGSHSRGFAIGELFGLPGRLAESGGAPCRFCPAACPVWRQPFMDELIGRYWPRGGLNGVLPRLGPARPGVYAELFERVGAEALFDSSKSLTWLKARLADRRDWRDASPHLILITRDGRAVINSFRRKDGKVSVETYTERWIERMVELERIFAAFAPERRVRVAYETLALAPEQTVRRICRVLDLPFEPSMLDYWTHEHHTLGGNKGTHFLVHRHRGADAADARAAPIVRQRDHYAGHGFGIDLDERWRDEMPQADLSLFEAMAGRINASYAYGD